MTIGRRGFRRASKQAESKTPGIEPARSKQSGPKQAGAHTYGQAEARDRDSSSHQTSRQGTNRPSGGQAPPSQGGLEAQGRPTEEGQAQGQIRRAEAGRQEHCRQEDRAEAHGAKASRQTASRPKELEEESVDEGRRAQADEDAQGSAACREPARGQDGTRTGEEGDPPRHRRVKAAPVRQPIPSSLGLQQGASAARSGREEMREHIQEHTETSPAITAGDLDANWALAYSSGDEAPGGDNPTPDQDVVDDIGHALGIEYGPTEELRGAIKVEERDKHRWELDPASSEDYGDRRRK